MAISGHGPLSGTIFGDLIITGDLTVLGDFNFGDVSTDVLTINGQLHLGDDIRQSFGNTAATPDFSIGVNSADSDKITLSRGGTLGTNNVYTYTKDKGHFEHTATVIAGEVGHSAQVSTSGSAAGAITAAKLSLLSGYTGASGTYGVYAQNQTAGTGTDEFTNVSAANYGEYIATTTGTLVGQAGFASGGDKSYGGFFRAIIDKAGADNIGIGGFAKNTIGVSSVGGFFGLMDTPPTYESAALVADNGASPDPIFLGRDNGTKVFQILDTGNILGGTVTASSGAGFRLELQGSSASERITLKNTLNSGFASNQVFNDGAMWVGMFEFGSTYVNADLRGNGAIASSTELIQYTDGASGSGGTSPMSWLIGGSAPATQKRMSLESDGKFTLMDDTATPLELQISQVGGGAGFPRTYFGAGQSSGDTNVAFRFGHKDSSSGTEIPTFFQVSTNLDTSYTNADTLQFGAFSTFTFMNSITDSVADGKPFYLGTDNTPTSGSILIETVANGQTVAFSGDYVDLQKGQIANITEVTAATYTVLATDYKVSIQRTDTGAHTVTLPAIGAGNHGQIYILKDADYNAFVNNITVDTTGADTIEDETDGLMKSNGEAWTLQANNTTKNWEVN